MALRAKDSIDKKLTKIYNDKVTVNLESKSTLSPEEFWDSMELIASMNKCFVNFAGK